MTFALLAILAGLALLVWSADRFVEGAVVVARHFGMPPLLIGMVIMGFGTSAPEMLVSAIAASEGNPALALGNAYGSNIANIALVLGITALLNPIAVQSKVLRRELPLLSVITALAAFQLWDNHISRADALVLLSVFAALMAWTIAAARDASADHLSKELEQELEEHNMPLRRAITWLVVGLIILIGSSRLLVWGAIDIAMQFGVSELIIGLTIVAIGTSLPELVSSVIAARKGEHDMALGNIIGSNLFNTLAVVGIAGSIEPITVAASVLTRDVAVMSVLTLSLFVIGFGIRGAPRINRLEGGILLTSFLAYTAWLVHVNFMEATRNGIHTVG